jgi:hypothetical protein
MPVIGRAKVTPLGPAGGGQTHATLAAAMAAAKAQHGTSAWAALSGAEKKAAIEAAQASPTLLRESQYSDEPEPERRTAARPQRGTPPRAPEHCAPRSAPRPKIGRAATVGEADFSALLGGDAELGGDSGGGNAGSEDGETTASTPQRELDPWGEAEARAKSSWEKRMVHVKPSPAAGTEIQQQTQQQLQEIRQNEQCAQP